MSDTDRLLTKILTGAQHMVIAVILPDGTPWAVPVHIIQRTATTFEWDSKIDTAHSQAIAADPRVALTMFSTQLDLGFYAAATAEEVSRRDDGYARYRATVQGAWINVDHIKRKVELA